jgi:type II secretion system protein G
MHGYKHRGFTLIELLIVVAIIAILAAIAVPNFLEAQTRAKVSRVKADLRTITTGLETYHIDNNSYVYQIPEWRALRINNNQNLVLERLTTPISYLNSVSTFDDPFVSTKIKGGNDLEADNPVPTGAHAVWVFNLYKYYARNDTHPSILPPQGNQPHFLKKPKWYILGSAGADGETENLNGPMTTRPVDNEANRQFFLDIIYDASNGTISRGSLYRVGGTPTGAGISLFHAAATAQ